MNRRKKLLLSTAHPFTQPSSQINSSSNSPRTKSRINRASYSPGTNLPSISAPNEEECLYISSLRGLYRSIHDAVSEFLNHNGPTKKIRNSIQETFFETDKYFNIFYGQLSKSGRASLPINALSTMSILTPIMQNSAAPFVRSWRRMLECFSSVKLNGVKMIHETITESLDSILSALEKVINGKGYNAGIHDVYIRKARKMQQKIWGFQRDIETFIKAEQNEKIKLEQKLVNEMRIFSRDVSTAFTSDFAKAATVFSDNETSRNRVYNNICEVIFLVHAITVFNEDQRILYQSIGAFNDVVTIIVDNLHLHDQLEKEKELEVKEETKETKKEEKKEKEVKTIEKENDNYFDPNLPLDEIIERARFAFRRSGVDKKYMRQFFESIKEHKKEYEETIKDQEKKIAEKDKKIENLETYRILLKDSNKKVADLITTTQCLKMDNKKLEETIENMKKSTNVVGLRKALISSQKKLIEISSIQSSVSVCNTDDELIDQTNEIIKEIGEKGCRKCSKNKKIFEKLHEILGSTMYVEETQLLFNKYQQLKKDYEILKTDLDVTLKEKKECSDTLYKVLSCFNISKPYHESLTNFVLSCVPEKLALMNNELQTEKENHLADINSVKVFMKNVFSHESTTKEKISDILKVLREKIDEYRLDIENKDSFIKTVGVRLQAQLGVQLTDPTPIGLVKKLLNILEKTENPLKPQVVALKRIQNESIEYTVLLEKELVRLFNCDFAIKEEDGIIQRLHQFVEILKTYTD